MKTKTYGKPTYIPQQFVKAVEHGWIDTRTNELLVSYSRLLQQMEADGVDVDTEVEQSVTPVDVQTQVETPEVVVENVVAVDDLLIPPNESATFEPAVVAEPVAEPEVVVVPEVVAPVVKKGSKNKAK